MEFKSTLKIVKGEIPQLSPEEAVEGMQASCIAGIQTVLVNNNIVWRRMFQFLQ